PYLIEIPARTTLPFHFFVHKGEEFGYVLAGDLQIKIGSSLKKMTAGDVVYLTTDIPTQWKNIGTDTARMIWVNIK
ncbi:MAG: cupin domain-containing protein, partial [Desulfobacterales bacterium]